jgi:hypothetical protein
MASSLAAAFGMANCQKDETIGMAEDPDIASRKRQAG